MAKHDYATFNLGGKFKRRKKCKKYKIESIKAKKGKKCKIESIKGKKSSKSKV